VSNTKKREPETQDNKWQVWLWEGRVQQNEAAKQKGELFRFASNKKNNLQVSDCCYSQRKKCLDILWGQEEMADSLTFFFLSVTPLPPP